MRYRLKHLFWFLFMPICIFNISGCSITPRSEVLEDHSAFTGAPCTAPCWYDLKVGESNVDEVINILPTIPFINPNTTKIYPLMESTQIPYTNRVVSKITSNCIKPDIQCISLIFDDNILSEVNVILTYPITLEESINSLGDPDYISFRLGSPVRMVCEVNFYYIQQQLVLASSVYKGSDIQNNCLDVFHTGKPQSNLVIATVRYLSEKEIDILLSSDPDAFLIYTGMITGN
jgi:hypothetical protein